MSKTDTSKTTKADTKAARKADVAKAAEARTADTQARSIALCTEVKNLSKITAEQVTNLITNISAGSAVVAGTYEAAKGNLSSLVTLVNKLALYLPRTAKEATTKKEAKA